MNRPSKGNYPAELTWNRYRRDLEKYIDHIESQLKEERVRTKHWLDKYHDSITSKQTK